ncbi:MAG: c-type cytochrome [Gemmatimonadales bacterium]
MRSSLWTTAILTCILSVPQHRGVAQVTDTASTSPPTTLARVYTQVQAGAGRNLYLQSCRSCHTPGELAGDPFWGKWVGKTVADLFSYLRNEMPKDNPGSFGDEDYANVTAYLLQLNAMPAGERAMAADSTSLAKIRITKADTVKQAETTKETTKKRTAP